MNELGTMVQLVAALERLRLALVGVRRAEKSLERTHYIADVAVTRAKRTRAPVDRKRRKLALDREKDASTLLFNERRVLERARSWLDRLLQRVTNSGQSLASTTRN